MKAFEKIAQEVYGTEDEIDHIFPRLSKVELAFCLSEYAEACCFATLEKVAKNAKCIHMGDGFHAGVDENSILSKDNVVIL